MLLRQYKTTSVRRLSQKKYRETHRNEQRIATKNWQSKNPEKFKTSGKNYKQKVKIAVMKHYSGGTMRCVCCDEKNLSFLTLDHPNNDGENDRERFGSGYGFYLWLIKSLKRIMT